jgi:pilus assembly protein Flp/PilA
MEGIKRFTRRASDRGASLVEYALLVALIAVVCIGAVTYLGKEASNNHQEAADGLGGGGVDPGCAVYEGYGYENIHRGTGNFDHNDRTESASVCYGTRPEDSLNNHFALGPYEG